MTHQPPFAKDHTDSEAAPRRRIWRRGIGLRVLALIVLFSSMVTLVATGIQLYLDYSHDVRAIQARLDDIRSSSLASLAVSLWNVDADGLRIHLEGIMRLPDMQYLEVWETAAGVEAPLHVSVGLSEGGTGLVREYPLIYGIRGEAHQIGLLRAEASLSGVYAHLRERVLVILVSQGLKTFLVSLFTLYIVHRLITRHLVSIADFIARYDSWGSAALLTLRRRHPRHPDELDRLVQAFRTMSTSLEAAYVELSGANRELESDIAERQTREQELQSALDSLAAANRELERFAYVASHDLQEPLRSIVSFTQLLERRYQGRLDAEADEYIGYIVGAGQRMHDLINDLLTYSRIERTEAPLTLTSTAGACEAAIRNLSESIARSGADVVVGPLPEIPCDGTQMMQLFQNLIGNAVKFHSPDQSPVIRVAAEREGDNWHFTVADNGIGMEVSGPDPFVIFRRQHPAHVYPGTGVGLAICKRIVSRHGGRIWIESEMGVGTTFHFTLPAG